MTNKLFIASYYHFNREFEKLNSSRFMDMEEEYMQFLERL